MVDVNGDGGFGTKAVDKIDPTLPELLENMPNAYVVGVENNSMGNGLDVILVQSSVHFDAGHIIREPVDALERRAPECSKVSGFLLAAQSMTPQRNGYFASQLPEPRDVGRDAIFAADSAPDDSGFKGVDAPGLPLE